MRQKWICCITVYLIYYSVLRVIGLSTHEPDTRLFWEGGLCISYVNANMVFMQKWIGNETFLYWPEVRHNRQAQTLGSIQDIDDLATWDF